jgi:hypothetical protein
MSNDTASVFHAYRKNTHKKFLAQQWNSGTLQMHSPVEYHGLKLNTARIFYALANLDMQALIIHRWFNPRHSSTPWIPMLHYLLLCGCQQTVCHLPDTQLVSAGAAYPAQTPLNMWIYAWMVIEGRLSSSILVMLCVNLSFGGRCPPHVKCKCTALAKKEPHMNGILTKKCVQMVQFQHTKIASVVWGS